MAAPPDGNYFVCTLGQAADRGDLPGHETISDFIEYQARTVPNHPAVGFAHPSTSSPNRWTHTLLDFRSIGDISGAFADRLLEELPTPASRRVVALLCPSTLDFLFNWLGLIRLGHAVLLFAPQCSSADIAHLCRECNVELLLYDHSYKRLAIEAHNCINEAGTASFCIKPTIKYDDVHNTLQSKSTKDHHYLRETTSAVKAHDVAYIHHTSGTSSGVPKPIPQSHRAAIGVLPHLDGTREATFSSTPLYHGGIADLFRAWTSDALIWLFHGKGIPITAPNILRFLDIAKEVAMQGNAPAIKYFSSVPYVLQMIAADAQGLEHLQDMDIVGVGGAALPIETGDTLVSHGVPLVSRFGSAECGFLLSSHRDYAKDKDWQYLRSSHGATHLRFEPRDEGLSELIVCRGWPHMAKKNRDDGSYATADLFEPHPSKPNAWKYHSRADSQLTLINGKKFDPEPIEAAIRHSELVQHVLVFGNGRPYPGALVFRAKSAKDCSNSAMMTSIAKVLENLNARLQSHSKIAVEMLVPMAYSSIPLETSSKGTILRGRVEQRYAMDIEEAYTGVMISDGPEVSDSGVHDAVYGVVDTVMCGKPGLKRDSDLFSFGVDSIASMRIRTAILHLLPERCRNIPLTIVEDCGTVDGLALFVVERRTGKENDRKERLEDDCQEVLKLVEEYANFSEPQASTPYSNGHVEGCNTDGGQVVVLTGATGALGSNILNLYRKDPGVRRIYCLLRGGTEQMARQRVNQAIKQRGFQPLRKNDRKVTIVKSDLGNPRLGIDDLLYQEIANSATIVMHLAWAVNFRLKLRSFVPDHIAGLRNLINLSISGRATPKFIFCSSVASVANTSSGTSISEAIEMDPNAASDLGYSRSKWVAEQICLRAHQSTKLRSRISIVRAGQLSGDSETGVWNSSEAWPLLLSSLKMTGLLPAIQYEVLDWVPIDIAAMAFLEIAEATGAGQEEKSSIEPRVYHVVNNDRSVTWTDALDWLKLRAQFEVVPPRQWIRKLEAMQHDGAQHPAFSLLSLWKNVYGESPHGSADEDPSKRSMLRYGLERTMRAAPAVRTVTAVDRVYFEKLWRWIEENL